MSSTHLPVVSSIDSSSDLPFDKLEALTITEILLNGPSSLGLESCQTQAFTRDWLSSWAKRSEESVALARCLARRTTGSGRDGVEANEELHSTNAGTNVDTTVLISRSLLESMSQA